jgi:hypothetical protein
MAQNAKGAECLSPPEPAQHGFSPTHRRLGSLGGFSLYAGVVVHADQGKARSDKGCPSRYITGLQIANECRPLMRSGKAS